MCTTWTCTLCSRLFKAKHFLTIHSKRIHNGDLQYTVSTPNPSQSPSLSPTETTATVPVRGTNVTASPGDSSPDVSPPSTQTDVAIVSPGHNLNQNDSEPAIFYNVYEFYADYKDMHCPIYRNTTSVSPQLTDLPDCVQESVTYVIDTRMTNKQCAVYYKHITKMQEGKAMPPYTSLSTTFPSVQSFCRYCDVARRTCVLDAGWVRAMIQQDDYDLNTTGCYRCPPQLLRSLLASRNCSIIPFAESRNGDGQRLYSTPWNTDVYKSYTTALVFGQVLLVDYFSDSATLSKPGTQGENFMRIRFSNLHPYSEQWSTISIAPNTQSIPVSFPSERRRALKLQLFHRFLYMVLMALLSASFSGAVINNATFFARVGMIVADQPEERTLLCLKRRDSDMDCTHCVLPSRIRSMASRHRSTVSSSDDDSVSPSRRRTSIRNGMAHTSIRSYPERNPVATVHHQLLLAQHRRDGTDVSSALLAEARQHTISHSAHEYPPVYACFAGLGSMPYYLYRVISFDKLHVMDLGVTRLICDVCNTLLQWASRSPLTRLIATGNNSYTSMPASARLSNHFPFKTLTNDSQAGMCGKIRRLSVPFLWVCLMGLANVPPDNDDIVQLALHLDVVNNFLCGQKQMTDDYIKNLQDFRFAFGCKFTSVIAVDVSTKLHRLMRHVHSHLIHLGCLRRGSSEKNEMAHKDFKSLYNRTNRHIDELAPPLLRMWCDPVVAPQ